MTANNSEPLENPKLTGRPTAYSKELADSICDLMASGKGLREICGNSDMPGRTTILRWLDADEDFRSQYARARTHLMDFYAEEVLKIAFDESGDILIDQDGDKSKAVANHVKVQRDRLKVDSLKWTMSKLAPRRYGTEPETDEDGAEGGVAGLMRKIDGRTRSINVRWEKIERTIVDPANKPAAEPEPVRMLTYEPAPIPANIPPESWRALLRVLDAIEAHAPPDEPEPPSALLEAIEAAVQNYYSECS